jgi:hypothetical protein
MKKSLLLLGVAVAAITSCTNDEVLDINKNTTIGFESFVNKGTRAANTTIDNLAKFQVWGGYETKTDVFAGKVVTKSGSVWSYTDPVAWTGNVYKFAACATGTDDEVSGVSFDFASGALTVAGYKVNQAHDLVAAVTTVDNTSLSNAPVNLNFQHMLSKVKFAIKNNSTENLTMQVSDITFTVKDQATATFSGTASWSTYTGSTTTITVPGTSVNVAKGETFTSADFLVMPQDDMSGVKATFTVQFFNGSTPFGAPQEYTAVSMGGTAWTPGYIYTYTAAPGAAMPFIQFGVNSVAGWESSTNVGL